MDQIKNMQHKAKTVKFFVAQCMEFTSLGEYHETLTAENAVKIYQRIPEEYMNGIKGIGIVIHTDGDPEYKDRHIDLMRLGTMESELLFEEEDKSLVMQAAVELNEQLKQATI